MAIFVQLRECLFAVFENIFWTIFNPNSQHQ